MSSAASRVFLFFTFTAFAPAEGKVWNWPSTLIFDSLHFSGLSENENTLQLVLKNLTSTEQTLWVQDREDRGDGPEYRFTLKPSEVLRLPQKKWDWGKRVFSVKTSDDGVQVSLEKSGSSQSFSAQTSRFWQLDLPEFNEAVQWKIHILNLHPGPQKISIQEKASLNSQQIQSKSYYVSNTFFLSSSPVFQKALTLNLQGEGRFLVTAEAILSSENRLVMGKVLSEPSIRPPSGARFFLMSGRNPRDSFVLSLFDENEIKKAEAALEKSRPHILIADISSGVQSWNRPQTSTGSPPWSWKVDRVLNFAESSLPDCDGTPRSVEENLTPWLDYRRICFWNIFLIRELQPEELKNHFKSQP